MILEGLRVLLFGVAGIFIVMAVIVLAVQLMYFISKKQKKDEADE